MGEDNALAADMDEKNHGRRLVGDLVRAQMGWAAMSGPAVERTGRVSRATMDRIKRGDEAVSEAMLRAAGDVLGLPRDFLLYVLHGDITAVRASAGDPDLLRWTLKLMGAEGSLNHEEATPPPPAPRQRRRK